MCWVGKGMHTLVYSDYIAYLNRRSAQEDERIEEHNKKRDANKEHYDRVCHEMDDLMPVQKGPLPNDDHYYNTYHDMYHFNGDHFVEGFGL